jgi:hypothetical protein
MASNDINADQNPVNISSLRSLPSHLSPQNPRHHSPRAGKFNVDSSSRRIRSRYLSAFTEIGLDGAADITKYNTLNVAPIRPGSRVRWRSQVDIHELEQQENEGNRPETPRSVPTTTWHQYGSSTALVSRLSFLAVVLAIMIPVLHMSPLLYPGPTIIGAEAGPIAPRSGGDYDLEPTKLLPRQNNPADACLRWSHQSAIVNGTLYMYGGRAKEDSNQASNTWSELEPALKKDIC